VQIADSRAKFNRSPRPALRALTRRVSAVHLLVVSQPRAFRKGHRSRSSSLVAANPGSTATWTVDRPAPRLGGEGTRRGPRPPGARHKAQNPGRCQQAAMRTPAQHLPGLGKPSRPRSSRRLVRQPQPKDTARKIRSSRPEPT
jgi:hypothetical protein